MSGTPERRVVFISHANPEENDFARWLAAQLANAGYEVWTDIAKLIGGEIFWDDIEDAIRNHSAKCVVVVSKASSKKPGVLDEVAVAVGTERSVKIPNFVVPIRFDDIDFAEFRANITRKNAIDFSTSWAEGLQTLLKVLDRDKVPKGRVGPLDVAQFGEAKIPPERRTRDEEESLISNWLPVTALSGAVSIFDLGLEEKKTKEAMASAKVPWFPYFRLVGTLGTEADLREDLGPEIAIERTYHFSVEEFLNGKPPGMPGSNAADTRRLMISLARQGWNRLMTQKGLMPYEMANGSIAWYVPKDIIQYNKSYYSDLGSVDKMIDA